MINLRNHRYSFYVRVKNYFKNYLIRLFGVYAPSILWKKSTHSQAGEDIALGNLFNNSNSGTYIDIGCHHPFRNSNTYLLYKMGWKGICIDPAQNIAKFFAIWRPRDTFINVAISNKSENSSLYVFNDPALNSLS
jgi:hypothetical protein